MKRLCLFAGYDKNGKIADYVVYYIKALSEFTDIYYMGDCAIEPFELEKLTPYVKGAYAYRHEKYDFGSWQELIYKLGWESLNNYDELLFVNDSCFGPLYSLKNVFDKMMMDSEWDFLGMSSEPYKNQWWFIQSFFLVFKRCVFTSDIFHKFIDSIEQQPEKMEVVFNYETPCSLILREAGFRAKRYMQRHLTTHHNWKEMIENGFPFFKTSNFNLMPNDYHGESLEGWKQFLDTHTYFPTDMIMKQFDTIGVNYRYLESPEFKKNKLKIKFTKIRKWFFWLHLTKRNKVLRILGHYFIYDTIWNKNVPNPILPLEYSPKNIPKRLCLFAGYDKNSEISKHVIHYVKSLSLLADVYYMADCEMSQTELDKLAPYTKSAYGYRHGKYDFGSWQELIKKLGWEKILEYDELIMCNDSCFGPLYPLKPIFDKASSDIYCDFWGFTDHWYYTNTPEDKLSTYHLQSYFVVLKHNAASSDAFRTLIDSVDKCADKKDLVRKYEVALTYNLQRSGFTPKKFSMLPYEPYFNWRSLIENGFPFIKVRVFTDSANYKYTDSLTDWESFLIKQTDIDTSMIKTYLQENGVFLDFFNTFKYKFMSLTRDMKELRKNIFRIKLTKKVKVIRVFGKDIINTTPKPIEGLWYEESTARERRPADI